jgi:4-diphosphocytidyl-2-C-methyl-D-erythritol kinase
MTAIREFAPAKVNLTLDIEGRRSDGYHEIASLVAFATVGDAVTIDPASEPGITVTGPYADRLEGTNILARAVSLLGAHAPALRIDAIHLEKHLPVAAGLGGGSADAGALLRAVKRANADASADVDWSRLARALGADVPACLAARPLWMTGVGEVLSEIPGGLPRLAALLVNPMAEVPADKTARVYAGLGASPIGAGYTPPPVPRFADRGALLDFMRARGNRLSAAAEGVVPDIAAVLRVLRTAPGVEYAAVSGGGPTCFGICTDDVTAKEAGRQIATAHPNWWVAITRLG